MLRYQLIPFSALVLCLVAVGACSSPADPAPSTGSALENPIVACQGEYESCRVAPGADIAQCQASMRTCLQSVATWVAQSRMLLEQCRETLFTCRSSRGDTPEQCQMKFDACIAPAFQPGTSGDDAGVADDSDAGSRYPRAGERTAGAGAAPVGGRGGSGGSAAPRGPGLPGFPPPFPGAAGGGAPFQTPGDTCNAGLVQCLGSGSDPLTCATQARECLRSSFSLLP